MNNTGLLGFLWGRKRKVPVALLLAMMIVGTAAVPVAAVQLSEDDLENQEFNFEIVNDPDGSDISNGGFELELPGFECDNSDDDEASARRILPGTTIVDGTCDFDTEDWYSFEVPVGALVEVELLFRDSDSDLDLWVSDSNQDYRGGGSSITDNENVAPIQANVGGVWTVRVYDWELLYTSSLSGGADYELLVTVHEPVEFFEDFDGDGYGNAESTTVGSPLLVAGEVVQPVASEGFVVDSTDCNDADGAVHPGVAEDGLVPDGVDNDCDELVDEDYVGVEVTFFADADGDGYGDAESTTVAVTTTENGEVVQPATPDGFVADATDCNDVDDSVFPGAEEIAEDDVDQNCDGEDGVRVLSITGRVFVDTNRDGIADADEDDVSGVEVDLFSAGSDGELGTDDDELVASATTASPFRFFDIADGAYLVVIDTDTLPTGLFAAGGTPSAEVSVAAGSVAPVDFSQQYAQLSSVLVDSDGEVLANTSMTLTDSAGNTFTTTTNDAGEFTITGSAGAPLVLGAATLDFLVNDTQVSVSATLTGVSTQISTVAAQIAQIDTTAPPALAFTGFMSEWLVLLGLLFLTAGIAAVAASRRFEEVDPAA